MSDAIRARGLPPTPKHATDAELSGLFRLIEEGVADCTTISQQPAGDATAPAPSRAYPAQPTQSEREGQKQPERSPAARTAHSGTFDARTSRAFGRLGHAVAAVLNR